MESPLWGSLVAGASCTSTGHCSPQASPKHCIPYYQPSASAVVIEAVLAPPVPVLANTTGAGINEQHSATMVAETVIVIAVNSNLSSRLVD